MRPAIIYLEKKKEELIEDAEAIEEVILLLNEAIRKLEDLNHDREIGEIMDYKEEL